LEAINRAGFGVGEGLKPLDTKSGLCVTVPGAAGLWHDLVANHGALSLAQVLAPAIRLADEGVPISPITASHWGGHLDAEGERVLRPNGRIPAAGELHRNADLAQTMRALAEQGAYEGFYRGPVAAAVVEAVRRHGGVLELEDLAGHRTKVVESISVVYKGVRIHETPPPSQGLAALIALRLIQEVERLLQDATEAGEKEQQQSSPLKNTTTEYANLKGNFVFCANLQKRSGAAETHLAVECMRVACAEALHHIADPLVQGQVHRTTQQLLGDQYIAQRARAIAENIHASSVVQATDYASFSQGETAYLCCVDGAGNACSMICSNYQGFGTGIMPRGCGFTLQNRGHNFSLLPGHPNQAAPCKRPYHTIIPALLTSDADGSLLGVIGGMVRTYDRCLIDFLPCCNSYCACCLWV
jgi:gamma-glutamyltranspeptidase / glutathione hydrolase